MLKDHRVRQGEVLSIIVRHYVDTAQPVGSRFVARELSLSSATIRNVMADLEEEGFITQPHTSAGRVPTDKGYRYYIDSLMRIRNVNDHSIRMINDQYQQAIRSLEDVMERTCHLISHLTNYVGITLFRQYDKVYLDGTSHIIEQPEFKDFKKLYGIIKCLEEKTTLLSLLGDDLENDRLTIHIGEENHLVNLKECSVVTRGYKIKGRSAGKLGVIGPKRMIYEKVIPTVELLADTVTGILEQLEM